MEWLNSLLSNQYAMVWIMAFAVFLLTQVLKIPIKLLTKKITNEKARKAVNSTILLLPFALGILAEYLYCTFALHTVIDWEAGITIATSSMAFYAGFERLGIKLKNELTETEEGQKVLEAVEEAQADGVVTVDEVKDITVSTITGKKSKKTEEVKEEQTETPQEVQDFLNNMDLGS